jgi:hypothetical protein
VERVARLIGPAAAAKQLGIARSSVYRMLGNAACGPPGGTSRHRSQSQSIGTASRTSRAGLVADVIDIRTGRPVEDVEAVLVRLGRPMSGLEVVLVRFGAAIAERAAREKDDL